MLIDSFPFHFGRNDFFAIEGSLCQNFPTRRADKTLSPKFDAVAPHWRFVTDPICRRDEATIGDSVAPLHCLPGRKLGGAIFFLLARVPSNRRRIENNLCPT